MLYLLDALSALKLTYSSLRKSRSSLARRGRPGAQPAQGK